MMLSDDLAKLSEAVLGEARIPHILRAQLGASLSSYADRCDKLEHVRRSPELSRKREITSQHTSAPWLVVQYDDCTDIETEDGVSICRIGVGSEANAHLVAAAPKMLAALRGAEALLSEYGLGYAIYEVREAIAEATKEWT